jgi:site-specific recombinase XerC
MDRHAADGMVNRLVRRAGIAKRIIPHSLRHSFITAVLDAGVPLRDVQEAASHADPRTAVCYDRGRGSLDRHATYSVATFIATHPAEASRALPSDRHARPRRLPRT